MKGDINILQYLAHESSIDVWKHFHINQNLGLTSTDLKGQF